MFKDRIAWMDYWMLDHGRADLGMKAGTADLATAFGPRETPTTTSRVILGYQGEGQGGGEVASGGFPLTQTQFTDAYVTAGDALTFDPAAVQPGTATWVNGSRRQAYSHTAGSDAGGALTSPTGPDERELATRFDEATAIAGPITANPARGLQRAGHGAVRAAHRPGAGRHAALPQPRHAARQPSRRRPRPVPADRRRTDLPALAPARRALAPHSRRGRRLPDRHLPGRPRVPARPRARRQSPRAAARRQRLRIRAEDASGGEHAAVPDPRRRSA